LAGLTFVVGSMLGTGLSLTVAQILQPLKNARLVILALQSQTTPPTAPKHHA
jgi:BASS family bile acid:Na+ symporter